MSHGRTHTSGFNSGSQEREHAHKHKPDPAPDPGPPNEAIVWNEIMLQAIALSGFGPPPLQRVRWQSKVSPFSMP